MIAASLAVIAVTVVLLFRYQHDLRKDRLAEKAVSLTRVIAEIPLNQIVPDHGWQNILEALYLSREKQIRIAAARRSVVVYRE